MYPYHRLSLWCPAFMADFMMHMPVTQQPITIDYLLSLPLKKLLEI